jgi:translation initiation factor 1A
LGGLVSKEDEAKQQKEAELISRIRYPRREEGEMFAVAIQLMGSTQIKATCEDGIERMCRITGKMRKRVWIRHGDLIIVKLWDFQPSRADIVWRFVGAQTEHLRRKGVLKNLPI